MTIEDEIFALKLQVEALEYTLFTLINWQAQTLGKQGVEQLVELYDKIKYDRED